MRARRLVLAVLPLLVFASLAGLLYVRLYAGDVAKLPSALVGQSAPHMMGLVGLDGSQGPSDADLRAGRVTIVNVFGSWCEPCHYEHPALLALAQDADLKAGKVALIGVAQKDKPENVRRFLGSEGNPYAQVVLDPDGRAGIDWGVYGVPETFIVRGDGVIAYRFVGPLTEETLRSVLLPEIVKAKG